MIVRFCIFVWQVWINDIYFYEKTLFVFSDHKDHAESKRVLSEDPEEVFRVVTDGLHSLDLSARQKGACFLPEMYTRNLTLSRPWHKPFPSKLSQVNEWARKTSRMSWDRSRWKKTSPHSALQRKLIHAVWAINASLFHSVSFYCSRNTSEATPNTIQWSVSRKAWNIFSRFILFPSHSFFSLVAVLLKRCLHPSNSLRASILTPYFHTLYLSYPFLLFFRKIFIFKKIFKKN